MFNLSLRGAQLPLLVASAGLGLMIAGCGGGGGSNLPTPGSGNGGLGTAGGTGGGGFALGAGSIVFVSTRDGNPEIYSLDLNGTAATNARRLTTNDAVDENPSRSPDGRRVVFSSQRDGNSEIYVIKSDGSGTPQRLTNDTGPAAQAPQDTRPVFSPDGNSILWQSTRGGTRHLYIMDATGANQREVTFADPTQPSFDGSWNPDSQRLLGFLVNAGNSNLNDLAVITPATTAATAANAQVLATGTSAAHPRYSPNGQRIVVFNAPTLGQARLQLLSPTGTVIGDGPTGGFNQLNPSFSPDSNRLVWDANTALGAGRQLYVANVAATGTQPAGVAVTNDTQGENYDASWTQ